MSTWFMCFIAALAPKQPPRPIAVSVGYRLCGATTPDATTQSPAARWAGEPSGDAETDAAAATAMDRRLQGGAQVRDMTPNDSDT
jgi:hypothetical protein